MKYNRPDTDYKKTIEMVIFGDRYNEICLQIRELIKKMSDPSITKIEIDQAHIQLEGFAEELKKIQIVLKQYGYMKS